MGRRKSDGLTEEIAMLRVVLRRVMALADEGRPLPELLRIAETLGKAATRLATLLKAERQLGQGEVTSALDEVLEEMIAELRADSAKSRGS
ncbi:MAG TPA: hypothetical protein GYA06_08740 [Chloroflexi bacterium]|jgi:hypothetical protein|nr:hypothetical protein [Chloroflexota bacterium]HPO57783.1 hypothetical protein [Anaerolineaceae bacterium]